MTFEDDVWTADPIDSIYFTFYDWKSAWAWVNDKDYSIENAEYLDQLFSSMDGGVQFPIPQDILDDP